jgi:hypothetical protein
MVANISLLALANGENWFDFTHCKGRPCDACSTRALARAANVGCHEMSLPDWAVDSCQWGCLGV